MNNENVNFYNELWLNEWQDMERYNPTAQHLERIIARLIKPLNINSLLDVGCGMGVNIKSLNRHFPNLTICGSDLSADILKIAEKYVGKKTNISYTPVDVAKNKINNTFDLVLLNQVLEHIEDDYAAMENIAKMSKKYVLITVPSGEYNSTSKLVGHVRHYTKSRVLDLLHKNNLEIISFREWGFPFSSLYKFFLNLLPEKSKKKIGLGKYGFFKKAISFILYLIFFGNIFNRGQNIIVLAKKSN
jgi:ubiquinone/menaquinone biosynthesis C-methylase UbiE